MRLVWLHLALLSLLGYACGGRSEPILVCTGSGSTPSFAQNVVPFLTNNCGCHSQSVLNRQAAPGYLNFDNQQQVTQNIVLIRQSILSGRMPADSSLDNNERCVFESWYEAGMPP